MSQHDSNRREFLSGRGAQKEVERLGQALADKMLSEESPAVPTAADTVRLSTEAMACEFSVVLNQGMAGEMMTAADALELIHELENQLTVYRPESELSQLNERAFDEEVVVEEQLFELLWQAKQISKETGGAFDPTSGPLIDLWRRCRKAGRIPTREEIESNRQHTGIEHVVFDEATKSVRFQREFCELNLGGIGKGYALDRAGDLLQQKGIEEWLLHGGFSSLLARGEHTGSDGWPVGLRNPLLPHETFGTILLKDRALSTSGAAVQGFRHEGKKYGHILDPRTGWPVDGLMSVTVLAPTAALADALSTAFFVMGLEKACEYCDNNPSVSCLLIPPPVRGRRLEPIALNFPNGTLFLETSPPERPQ